MSSTVLLSILVPSVPERTSCLKSLCRQLRPQMEGRPVEMVVLMDDRLVTLGRKRQQLNDMSKGRFIVHVDDDDTVSDDFVETLLAIIQGPEGKRVDVITYICRVHLPHESPKLCYYSKNFRHANRKEDYLRKPNHLCCFRREVAMKVAFDDIGCGEDDDWAERIAPFIHHEFAIDRVLYDYRWQPKPDEWFMTQSQRSCARRHEEGHGSVNEVVASAPSVDVQKET